MSRFLLSIVGISVLMIWLKILAVSIVNLMVGGPDGTPGWWMYMLVKEAQVFLGFVAGGAILLIPTVLVFMHVIAWVRGLIARVVVPAGVLPAPGPRP